MGAPAVQVKNKLSDGRTIRALEGTFTQEQMFTLRSSGLYAPATEGIMTVKDYDQSIQSGVWKSISGIGWWRTGWYGFYPRGFENENLPIGKKIIWVEIDSTTYTLDVPDVPVMLANGETVGLRQAVGMGIIKLEKLRLKQIDENSFSVSVTDDFDPALDLKVKDIMRPRGWALVDADGYPLKSNPSNEEAQEARYSGVIHADEFWGVMNSSTGHHGSVIVCFRSLDGGHRELGFFSGWNIGSDVAVIKQVGIE